MPSPNKDMEPLTGLAKSIHDYVDGSILEEVERDTTSLSESAEQRTRSAIRDSARKLATDWHKEDPAFDDATVVGITIQENRTALADDVVHIFGYVAITCDESAHHKSEEKRSLRSFRVAILPPPIGSNAGDSQRSGAVRRKRAPRVAQRSLSSRRMRQHSQPPTVLRQQAVTAGGQRPLTWVVSLDSQAKCREIIRKCYKKGIDSSLESLPGDRQISFDDWRSAKCNGRSKNQSDFDYASRALGKSLVNAAERQGLMHRDFVVQYDDDDGWHDPEGTDGVIEGAWDRKITLTASLSEKGESAAKVAEYNTILTTRFMSATDTAGTLREPQ